jgi:hypothetical protein
VIERGFDWLARLLFVAVALALFGLAISLVVSGGWLLVQGAFGGEVGIYSLMNGVGLLIVSLAIADVAKVRGRGERGVRARCALRPRRCAR